MASDRRKRILSAARRLFAGGFYERVTLRNVAQLAELDVWHVFNAFGSKEGLFEEALRAALDGGAVTSAFEDPRRLSQALLGHGAQDVLEPFLIFSYAGASPVCGPIILKHTPSLVRGVGAAVHCDEPLRARTFVLLALVLGLLTMRVLLADTVLERPPAEMVAVVEEMIVHTLEGSAPAAPSKMPRTFTVDETRAAILRAAEVEFARAGFDHATTRKIAASAGIDAALIIRYFGSKEGLFREVIQEKSREAQNSPGLAFELAGHLMFYLWARPHSEFDMALRSASSPVAAEIVRKDIEDRYRRGMGGRLAGENVQERVHLIVSLVLGSVFCSKLLELDAFTSDVLNVVHELEKLFGIVAAADE